MHQDRVPLFRRGSIWYVQFYNPHTRKYLSALSTGETNRNAELLVVAQWLRDGLPDPARGRRRLQELLDLDIALSIIRSVPLSPDDTERIIRILKDRQMIENAPIGAGPGSETFTTFLERFWDYEESPYVRERPAHGQRISRRYCYNARNRLDSYWKPNLGKDKARVASKLKQIWQQPDRASAMRTARIFIAEFRHSHPDVVETLRQGLEDSLQFYTFEELDGKKISSTNMQERLHEEVRRRSRAVEIFPSKEWYVRLVTAFLIEYSEEWSVGRNYIRTGLIEGVGSGRDWLHEVEWCWPPQTSCEHRWTLSTALTVPARGTGSRQGFLGRRQATAGTTGRLEAEEGKSNPISDATLIANR
jgi:hypothetical protein